MDLGRESTCRRGSGPLVDAAAEMCSDASVLGWQQWAG